MNDVPADIPMLTGSVSLPSPAAAAGVVICQRQGQTRPR